MRALPVLPITATTRARASVRWLRVRRWRWRADGTHGAVRGARRVLRVELGPGLAAVMFPLLVACAASPDWAAEPVPPAAWGGDAPPAVCLSPDVTAAELGFAARVWGAREDCGDSAAVAVGVESLDRDALGTSDREPPRVTLDPRAWAHRPAVTLAHEIGHVLGFAHEPQGCALMAPRLDARCPGYVAPDGAAFRY